MKSNRLGLSLTTVGAVVLAFGVSFGAATAANATTTTDNETISSIRIATVSGSGGITGN